MTNKNSIIPAIQEGERFINFMNKRFNLELPNNLIISMHKQKKNILGTFTPNKNPNAFIKEGEKDPLHIITINTLYLNKDPFETLAHELSHFINEFRGVKDCSSNQYHNKHFKKVAESLLLKVEKQKGRGYAHTERTELFNKMLEEFKPSETAFKMFQNETDNKTKTTTRNFLFMCSNACYKVRCGNKEFEGCLCKCGSPFEEQIK